MKGNASGNRYTISVVVAVALAGLLFGYDTAVISGAEQSIQKYLIDGTGFGSFVHGLTVSSALIGCIIGGFLSGYLSENIGRKNTLILAAILFFLSALLSAYPEALFFQVGDPNNALLVMFNIYRVIGGIGVGLASAIAPVYISEIAPEKSRGKFVALYTLAIGVGSGVVYIVNMSIASGQTAEWIDNLGWRLMLGSEIIPALLFLILLLFVPETPRYLAMNNKNEKALSILEKVNDSKEVATNIITEINESLNRGEEKQSSLFSYGKTVIFIGIAIAILQQFIGINVILYYAPRIFSELGAGQMASLFQTVIIGLVNVTFMALALRFVDRTGRKPLLIFGSVGCAVSLFAVSILALFGVFGVSTLVFIILYTAFFQLTWGVVTWVFVAEIFPNKVRGQAMSIAVALHWLANLTVSSTFPFFNSLMGPAAFSIYGIISIISAYFIWKHVPETKGKTLEELEDIWLDHDKQNFSEIKGNIGTKINE